MFELNLMSQNYRHLTDMSGTADMSCRFGHPSRHDIKLPDPKKALKPRATWKQKLTQI